MLQVVIVYLLRWEFGLEIIYFRKKKFMWNNAYKIFKMPIKQIKYTSREKTGVKTKAPILIRKSVSKCIHLRTNFSASKAVWKLMIIFIFQSLNASLRNQLLFEYCRKWVQISSRKIKTVIIIYRFEF